MRFVIMIILLEMEMPGTPVEYKEIDTTTRAPVKYIEYKVWYMCERDISYS